MALDATKVVVGQSGTVLYGTVGVTQPTSATAATTGYSDVGYLDDGGCTLAITPTTEEFFVWQATAPIRRVATQTTYAFSGNFAEWNATSIPVLFGGGTVAAGTYTFPETPATNDFAGCIDVVDGSTKLRFVFPKANQTETVEAPFNKSALSTLAFNFGVLAPGSGTAPLIIYKNSSF
jgi:hypothetical protein